MKFKKILVTGGAGYVGAVLIPKLLKKGYEVSVLDWYIYGDDIFSMYREHPNLIEIKGDLRDIDIVKKLLAQNEVIVHLACISNDPSFELDPNLGKSINYDATCLLGDLAQKAGVKRFIYASSSSVYGVKKEAEVNETLDLEPLTDYSKYKALSEKYLLSKNTANFTVLILRPATVCGYSPRLRLDLTVNILTIQALINKKMIVFGGSQLRPNIHIEDITDLYIQTLTFPNEKIGGKIYNAGYENYSVLEIAQLVKKTLADPTIQIDIQPTQDLRSYKISSRRILHDLNFMPRHTIEDAILDLQLAYESGKISNAFTNPRYYNIQMMKKLDQEFLSNKIYGTQTS